MGSVCNGICLTFQCVMQETVDEDRTIRCNADSSLHITGHALIIIYDFHAASAKDVGRTNHNGITDPVRNPDRFFHGGSHSCFRHGDIQFVHDGTELISVLSQIDNSRRSTEDLDTVPFQIRCQIQRRLSPELGDNAYRLFLLIDRKNILQGQRFEIQLVGGVVVS